jgi:hypothetical protein
MSAPFFPLQFINLSSGAGMWPPWRVNAALWPALRTSITGEHPNLFPPQFAQQLLNGHFRITQNVPQNLQRNDFSCMNGYCSTTTKRISVNLMAAS